MAQILESRPLTIPRIGQNTHWIDCPGSVALEKLANLVHSENRLFMVVTKDMKQAFEYRNAFEFFAPDTKVLQFPDYEILPYDLFSPAADIVSQRLFTLYSLPHIQSGIIVVPIQTLLQKICPREYILPRIFDLQVGSQLDIQQLAEQLTSVGYRRVDGVFEHGEFAVRGSIIDFFPMGIDTPFRIDFFDNTIESLRTFDPETQRSQVAKEQVQIMPAHEYPLDVESIKRFRNAWHDSFEATKTISSIYRDISEGIPVEGIECYLPLFFDEMHSLLHYVDTDTVVVLANNVSNAIDTFLDSVEQRYKLQADNIERPLLAPPMLYFGENELRSMWNKHPRIQLHELTKPEKHTISLGGIKLPNVELEPRSQDPARKLRSFIANVQVPVLVVADSLGRLQHLMELLTRAHLTVTSVASYDEFQLKDEGTFSLVGSLEDGLWTEDRVILTESQILGISGKVDHRRRLRNRSLDPDSIIRNLTELHPGTPVVHIDHGVGRYVGLENLVHRSQVTEFVTLEYKDGDRLYVPVSSLHLISRYTGAEIEKAPLHKLGSDAWAKAKKRAARRIYDVAVELLNIYARREAMESNSLPKPDDDYARFCDQCEFELTPDQIDATTNLLEDLSRTRATDRLICGDVGFGKTEVAMRAAFHVVQNGFQVIVLVPTTILAQQHLETFSDRFASWPINIDLISRFRSKSELEVTLKRIESGSLDIVIGTHRILHTSCDFKNLGLLIIDEEHRFGVRDKERIKNLKAEVDTVTLTATPIPRTLNMSMGGLRDISIITTPPAKRLAVKTFILPYNPITVTEAISRELARGGQVFYLHNKVQTIHDVYEGLKKLVPHARVDIGHGQMNKSSLERVMSNFYHRKSNVLVCTTIIESGIDIPNANTIIIDRADRFGLAQLHQLRGRVGRSTRQAYAYLLTVPDTVLTLDAKKRLDAIANAGELGSGFNLAVHDLEIRGAGELLGQQQHGQLESIGFTLYMQMLSQTVETLKRGMVPNFDDPIPMTHEINLHTSVLFPDDYLPNIHTRLILYKRLSAVENQFELDLLKSEVIDRFGPLPMPAEHLFRSTYLKLQAQKIGLSKINLGPDGGRIEFMQENNVDTTQLARQIAIHSATLRLSKNNIVHILQAPEEVDERFSWIEKFVQHIGFRQ